MCYDIKTSLNAQLKKAKRENNPSVIAEIEEQMAPMTDLPLFHSSGFDHPKLFIYTAQSPNIPIIANWGLVPDWINGEKQKNDIWNSTLNARGESIFEKPSFKDAAKDGRCIIYIDGFYEHHYRSGQRIPHLIFNKNKEPLAIAGLWNEWKNEHEGLVINTFSIVTSPANKLMSEIHNNPKIESARMPLILSEADEAIWLNPKIEEKETINSLIKAAPDGGLEAYTVRKLKGKSYLGNVEKTTERFEYAEIHTLFD
jgi:putative SOS response-associated peptidase YedK